MSTNKEEREHGQITSWTILTIRVAGVTYLDVPATVQCTPLSFPERWASRPISFNEMQSNQTPEQLISPTQVLDASHPKHKAGSYAGEQQWIFISRRPTANQQCHPRTSGGVNYVDLSSWFAPSVRLVGGQPTHSWFFKSPPFQLTTQLGYTTCSLLQSWHYCWISLFVNLYILQGIFYHLTNSCKVVELLIFTKFNCELWEHTYADCVWSSPCIFVFNPFGGC